MIIYELAMGQTPYGHLDSYDAMKKIVTDGPPVMPTEVDRDIRDLMEMCLKKNQFRVKDSRSLVSLRSATS